jgi:hypothetical protein
MPSTDALRRVRLTAEAIDAVFDAASEQADYVLGLYRLVIPDFDRVAKVQRWPKVSPAMTEYIFARAIAFDRLHHPGVMAGGLWLNVGFSTDEQLRGGQVTLPEVVYES